MSEEEGNSTKLKLIKGFGLVAIFIICIIFGIIPKRTKCCQSNPLIISLSNAFSGGLFLGIGLLHLLPDANYLIKTYYKNKKKNPASNHTDPDEPPFPIGFITVFIIYGLMLFIEKVAFPDIEHEKAESIYSKENDEEEEEEDDEEKKKVKEIKSPILRESDAQPAKEEKKEDMLSLEITKGDKTAKNKLNSYILMVALSFHTAFECLALGIQGDVNAAIILVIALVIHKWAEALTVGIAFIKGKLSTVAYYVLMVIFCALGPIGGVVGFFLTDNVNELVQGILISVSVGTFLYISCSEVISEEFDNKEHKYFKFFVFIIGGFCAFALNLFEYLTAEKEPQPTPK